MLRRCNAYNRLTLMATLYLSLGTNMGNRQSNLDTALKLIGQRIGTVQAQSRILETEPWGFESPNSFLNMAVQVKTDLGPRQALLATQAIEKEMGRTEKSVGGVYHDRHIDIDILLFDDVVLSTRDLTIPHPLMHERMFVMKPLAEIAPNTEHPVLHKTIRQIADEME